VTKSDVGGAWEMERLVEGAVDIPVDDKDHYKHCNIAGEGDNKDSWALGVVVKSPGDSPPLSDSVLYRGV